MLPATQACCVAVASLFSKHTNVSGGGGEGGGGAPPLEMIATFRFCLTDGNQLK